MSNIHFPTDPKPAPVSKKSRTQSSVQHADAVTNDPKHQHKNNPQQDSADGKKPYKPGKDQSNQSNNQLPLSSREIISRGDDRRQFNRRQQHQNVLLNTRSGQDRRQTPGQRKDDSPESNTPFGVDTKA